MPCVGWECIKTLTNVLRIPNIVSNTISMSSRKTESRRRALPAGDRMDVDDADRRRSTDPSIPPGSPPSKQYIPPIPACWTFEGGKYPTFFPLRLVLQLVFQFLCLISFGHTNLEPVWKECYEGCEEGIWKEQRKAVGARLKHVNVVVRLQ